MKLDNSKINSPSPQHVTNEHHTLFRQKRVVILIVAGILVIVIPLIIISSQVFILYRMHQIFQEDQERTDQKELIKFKLGVVDSVVREGSPVEECFLKGKQNYEELLKEGCSKAKKAINCDLSDLQVSELIEIKRILTDTINRCSSLMR